MTAPVNVSLRSRMEQAAWVLVAPRFSIYIIDPFWGSTSFWFETRIVVPLRTGWRDEVSR